MPLPLNDVFPCCGVWSCRAPNTLFHPGLTRGPVLTNRALLERVPETQQMVLRGQRINASSFPRLCPQTEPVLVQRLCLPGNAVLR